MSQTQSQVSARSFEKSSYPSCVQEEQKQQKQKTPLR